MATPMLLTIGVSGLAFAGADVGGFFGNPSTELMIRWYQAGSFQPFFRAHAHIDTARREPWLFGEDVLNSLRDIVRTRYTYLPLWYTLFAAAAASGTPPMRPMWLEFPSDRAVLAMDDQWMVGGDLLVKPVAVAGDVTLPVYFPAASAWYDAVTGQRQVLPSASTAGAGVVMTVAAPLNTIPVFQKGGSIVPRQMRARRSSSQMSGDPYTLIVALDPLTRTASGTLYLDDGATTDAATKGAFRLRQFSYRPLSLSPSPASFTLSSAQIGGGKAWAPGNVVERILVYGAGGAPQAVTITAAAAADEAPAATGGAGAPSSGKAVEFAYDAAVDVLTLRRPDAKVAYDWVITLLF